MNIKSILRATNQWFSNTPDRALDQAYKAALMIKAIEDEHFNGKKISAASSDHSDSVISYFESDLKKYLNIIKVRLAEFKLTRSVVNSSEPQRVNTTRIEEIGNLAQYYPLELNEQQSITIEKLNFIDEIVAKYSSKEKKAVSASLVPVSQNQEKQILTSDLNQILTDNTPGQPDSLKKDIVAKNGVINDIEPITEKTGVLPRSILRTFNRLQEELDPNAEEKVVKNFRNSKLKTLISLKFILTLIIVPILTHQISKTFLVGPVIEHWRNNNVVEEIRSNNVAAIFLNEELEEEAFKELQAFEEKLRFQGLLGGIRLSDTAREEEVKKKATELADEYRDRGTNAIKNVISDLLSLMAFGLVILYSKQEILILKSFMDDIVYGLSDSAKAFIIILFTDMFVGFHSPHGWEVILSGISRHLGLPESHDFIFLFIATFPVILDSVFKYWIFRYLNRVSPSAVATYKNMNE